MRRAPWRSPGASWPSAAQGPARAPTTGSGRWSRPTSTATRRRPAVSQGISAEPSRCWRTTTPRSPPRPARPPWPPRSARSPGPVVDRRGRREERYRQRGRGLHLRRRRHGDRPGRHHDHGHRRGHHHVHCSGGKCRCERGWIGFSIAGAGADAVNMIRTTTHAYVENSDLVSAGDIEVQSDDTSTINASVRTAVLAASGGVYAGAIAIGGATAHNLIGWGTDADAPSTYTTDKRPGFRDQRPDGQGDERGRCGERLPIHRHRSPGEAGRGVRRLAREGRLLRPDPVGAGQPRQGRGRGARLPEEFQRRGARRGDGERGRGCDDHLQDRVGSGIRGCRADRSGPVRRRRLDREQHQHQRQGVRRVRPAR